MNNKIKVDPRTQEFCFIKDINWENIEDILKEIYSLYQDHLLYMNVCPEDDMIVVEVSTQLNEYDAFLRREKTLNILYSDFRHSDLIDLRHSLFEE